MAKVKANSTMEVPKTIKVRIDDGIMESVDSRGGEAWTLFKHLHQSMNNRNSIAVLKQLAAVHGISVEVEE